MGLDGVEIGVYIYLFYRLVGDGDAAASTSGIVNRLSPILCHIPKEYRQNFSANTVGTAVRSWLTWG